MPLIEHKSIFAHQGIDLIYLLHKNRRFCFLLKVLSQYWSDPLSGIDCLLRAWLDQGQSILTETASNVRIAPHTTQLCTCISLNLFCSLYFTVPHCALLDCDGLTVPQCTLLYLNRPQCTFYLITVP